MGWFPQQVGGLDRVYSNLVRHLPEVGVRTYGLVTGSPVGSEPDVHAFASPTAPLLARWWRVRHTGRALLARQPVDLVASHFALYTFPLLDLIGPRPLVVHFHGPWADEGAFERGHQGLRSMQHALEHAVYRRASRYIVLSEAFATVLQDSYCVPADRIRIVPGGTEVERFAGGPTPSEARYQLGWPQDRPIVLTVRRLARRMGLEVLVEAMRQMRGVVPDVLLYIAGRGPQEEALRRYIAEAGLGDHVRLLGYVSEDALPLVYRAATFSVVPTQALEGFGLVTAESLAAGTPVFVTPVGGLPEAVRDLDPVLVFDGTDAEAMASRLTEALRGQIPIPAAADCQIYARTRFDWSTVAQRVRAVYEEVL